MKGCRTEEDIKSSMRNYFRKEREKQKQNRSPPTNQQVQTQPNQSQPQQQSPPQIVYAQQPVQQQQPPIIIQQPAQQQTPVIIQQQPQQPVYQQPQTVQKRKSLLSRVVLATALTGVLITGIWMYQGGLDMAVQNWTEIFYTLKNFAQGMMR